MKKSLYNICLLTTPLLLVIGCAENRRDASVSYSPALSESPAPTSDRASARVYPEPASSTDITAVPEGATPSDWKLAQEIRGLLMSDPKLGNAPMAAVVKNGVVTLQGSVRNKKDRQKLHDEISALPGVQRVDDEMDSKNPTGIGPGETKNY